MIYPSGPSRSTCTPSGPVDVFAHDPLYRCQNARRVRFRTEPQVRYENGSLQGGSVVVEDAREGVL